MKDIIFIADLFADEFPGGAELVNDQLIRIFEENGHNVERIKCEEVTSSYVKDNKDKFFIVSNFMRLNKSPKEELMKTNYVLYEHDHKYVINRNPAAFADLKVPDQQLDNLDLYKNANAVFCQSKIHKRAIDTNVQTKKTINLGSSLWSPEFLDKIGKIEVNKTKKAAIVEEKNPIKQQQLAENFCVENNIEYDLVRANSPLELATILSQYEFLVFFPKVLETFSRVSVEAKMVGCKLYTNNLLGAASEDWFKEDRSFIINQMKEACTKTYKSFLDVINNDNKSIQSSSDITVILNAYRRPYNLEKQIESIKNQTVKPNQIWLWINQHEDNEDFDFSKLKVDRIFHNDYNWKFYGRFAAALLSDTEYVAIFDDDTIPGNKWFENCLSNMEVNLGIQGSAGIILHDSKYYMRHDRCGWPTQNKESTRVDLVGHAWFFKRDWLQYLWREKPYTWDNGEDIQFSYLAQKYGNIQTFCPPHPPEDKSLHGSILGNELGIDDKATSTNQEVSHQQFFHERDTCVQNAIRHGWKTVRKLSL